MINILLFGPPGSGKGTQSKEMIKKYNLVHLSTGDILRAEIESNSKLGQAAKKMMGNTGEFASDEIVIKMIGNKFDENAGASGFVLDGFPRTVAQAEALDVLMKDKGMPISVMFALKVETSELKRRLIARGKRGFRSDDTPEIIENRIKIYKERTEQVSDYYEEQGKLKWVNGEGEVSDIFKQMTDVLDNL